MPVYGFNPQSDVTSVPMVSLNAVPPAPVSQELSSRYLLNRANVHFYKCFAFKAESRPFIVVRHDINAEDVMGVMQTDWRFLGKSGFRRQSRREAAEATRFHRNPEASRGFGDERKNDFKNS